MIVVGAGIVGLATARSLLRTGAGRVLVLEAEDEVGLHQTGHNSGVVHSGLYYAPGSLKARACREGRPAMFRFCERAGVPVRRSGKLIVATEPGELDVLEELRRRGESNGLDGLRRLTAAEIIERAPGVTGCAGLWVPQTGLTDFRAVARALAIGLQREGAEVRTRARLLEVVRDGRRLRLLTTAGEFTASMLVNCAGLHSDRVARMCGVEPGLRIVPFRGDYFEVTSPPEALQRWPVYPVPHPRLPFLGVHFTPDLAGHVHVGPNASLAFSRHGYRFRDVALGDLAETLSYPGFWRVLRRYWRTVLREAVLSSSRSAFALAARRLVPELDGSRLRRFGSGVRAQAVARDGTLIDDFRIAEGERSLHVLNAPSPAATAALAIGATIARRVCERRLS